MPTTPMLTVVLIILLLLASACDLHRRKIPNRLLACGLLAAFFLHVYSGAAWSLLSVFLAGAGVGLLMFLPLYLLGGMAAGDVKLMATVGAFVGPGLAFQSSLATYIAGGLLALTIVLFRKRTRAAMANAFAILHPMLLRLQNAPLAPDATATASVGGMPYAVAISAGTGVVLWIHHS